MVVPAVTTVGILDADLGLLQVGNGRFLHMISRDDLPWITLEGADTFEGSSLVAVPSDIDVLAAEHPLNSYDLTYRYCRTAIKVALDPLPATPLLAVVRALAELVIVRVLAVLCGRIIPATSFTAEVLGGVTSFLHPATHEGYLYINVGLITQPFNIDVTLASGEHVRNGYIRVIPA